MQLAICNNTKENLLLEPEKINVDLQNYKFLIFRKLPVFSQFLGNLTFVFSGSYEQ